MAEKSTFPREFLWGAATSAYQVEGGIENCDWAQAAREGKVPACGRACDHYHRFEADFDIAKELGHNAHRFSIEWARIEPEEGKFDEEAIQHYRTVLEALRARRMEPFVTLWHFTLPVWFVKTGGWKRKDASQVFARYCAHVVAQFDGLATRYATINEPIVYSSNGWVRGIWPPFMKFSLAASMRVIAPKLEMQACAQLSMFSVFTYLGVRHALADAHNAAYREIKKVNSTADVSIVKNVIVFDGSDSVLQKLRALVMNWHWTHSFMKKIAPQCDSIGLNYYFYKKFGDTTTYRKTDMNWDFVPEKIELGLAILSRYKKPLYVAEAGIADASDKLRAEYIQGTVQGVQKALEAGIDVRAMLYWSLLDNFEWAAGFGEKFGLVEIDYNTLQRTIRPSALVYRDLIRTHQHEGG